MPWFAIRGRSMQLCTCTQSIPFVLALGICTRRQGSSSILNVRVRTRSYVRTATLRGLRERWIRTRDCFWWEYQRASCGFAPLISCSFSRTLVRCEMVKWSLCSQDCVQSKFCVSWFSPVFVLSNCIVFEIYDCLQGYGKHFELLAC